MDANLYISDKNFKSKYFFYKQKLQSLTSTGQLRSTLYLQTVKLKKVILTDYEKTTMRKEKSGLG